VISLRDVAADLGERLDGRLVLDTLGDDGEAEVVAEIDGGLDEKVLGEIKNLPWVRHAKPLVF